MDEKLSDEVRAVFVVFVKKVTVFSSVHSTKRVRFDTMEKRNII